MEEQKIESKEVKMDVVKGDAGKQKLSYEELNQACADMSQQLQQQNYYIQQMRSQMQQMSLTIQSKRMDYLFKVVEISSKENVVSEYPFFAKDFVEQCIGEIQESLTLSEEETSNEKED